MYVCNSTNISYYAFVIQANVQTTHPLWQNWKHNCQRDQSKNQKLKEPSIPVRHINVYEMFVESFVCRNLK